MFQGFGEGSAKVLTALAPSTAKISRSSDEAERFCFPLSSSSQASSARSQRNPRQDFPDHQHLPGLVRHRHVGGRHGHGVDCVELSTTCFTEQAIQCELKNLPCLPSVVNLPCLPSLLSGSCGSRRESTMSPSPPSCTGMLLNSTFVIPSVHFRSCGFRRKIRQRRPISGRAPRVLNSRCARHGHFPAVLSTVHAQSALAAVLGHCPFSMRSGRILGHCTT